MKIYCPACDTWQNDPSVEPELDPSALIEWTCTHAECNATFEITINFQQINDE